MMVGLLLSLLSAAAVTAPNIRAYPAVLVSCHDGDTCAFDLILEDVIERLGMELVRTSRTVLEHQVVRLCGLNAPELNTAGAVKARDALVGMLHAAKVIEVRILQQAGHDARDKYGRWLAWLVADGEDLNARLLREGLAAPYLECK